MRTTPACVGSGSFRLRARQRARLFVVGVFVLADLQVERCGDMPHQRVEYRSAVALLHFLVEDAAGSDVEPLVFSPERNAFIGTHDRVAFAELGLCARARGVDE